MVWKLASDRNFRLGNADVTIFAQKPKLAPHLDQMRVNLARAIDADAKLLNVKASSPEGLGALGRGDGMAAAAIVVIES
jgi:2-C-methyl-D-erythritol 2,4-cyclodiphosphate synthase